MVDNLIESGIFENPDIVRKSTAYDLTLMIRAKNTQMRQTLRNENVHFGGVMAAVYNTVPSKTRKVWTWSDFYRDFAEPRRLTPEEIYRRTKIILGGRHGA